jgi:CRP-like cAMP-binding protein
MLAEVTVALASNPNQNHLLAALPIAEFEPLIDFLTLVPMPLGKVLYEPGIQLEHAYFPTTAVVSLRYVMESGAVTETAGVGNEGLVGISLLTGGETTSSSAVVVIAGHGYQVERQLLKDEFGRAGTLQSLLLRYIQALMTQMAQNAVCNQHHSMEQRLCRWLLVTLDRAPSQELTVTHELIAHMLGVRREGVTQAIGKLQRDGLLRYRRGHIEVLERSRLAARGCECYAVVKNETRRLLYSMHSTQTCQRGISVPNSVNSTFRHIPALSRHALASA